MSKLKILFLIALVLILVVLFSSVKNGYQKLEEVIYMYDIPEMQSDHDNETRELIKSVSFQDQVKQMILLGKLIDTGIVSIQYARLRPVDYNPVLPPLLLEFNPEDRIPVIIIPGLCQISSKLTQNPPTECSTNDWESLWINPLIISNTPMGGECWKKKATVYYKKDKYGDYTFQNLEGLETEANYFGTLRGIDYMSDFSYGGKVMEYFKETTDCLRIYGYTDGVDLFGAPYESRTILNKDVMAKWIRDTKKLIQYAYTRSGDKKVALLGHSVGCLVTHYFLHQQTNEWKNKYISKFISVAGPYGGIPKVLRVILGTSLSNISTGSIAVDHLIEAGSTVSALYLLLPKEDLFGSMEILKIGDKVYRPRNYEELFDMAGKKRQYLHSIPFRNTFNMPNGTRNEIIVPFFTQTETQYVYKDDTGKTQPKVLTENVYYKHLQQEGRWPSVVFLPANSYGDGTAPFLSLFMPVTRWTDGSVTRVQPISSNHIDCIRDPLFYAYLIRSLHMPTVLNVSGHKTMEYVRKY